MRLIKVNSLISDDGEAACSEVSSLSQEQLTIVLGEKISQLGESRLGWLC